MANFQDASDVEQSNSNTDMDQITALYSETDDGTLPRLKAIFFATGRGRRPKLPKVQFTNRLLIQIHRLMTETKSSWEEASKWLGILFPGYPKHWFPKHIRDVLASAAVQATDSRMEFFDSLTADLDFIGKLSADIGLGRKCVYDFSEISVKCRITNGLFMELSHFCQSEKLNNTHLLHVLKALDPELNINDTKFLRSEIARVKNQFTKLSRNRSRNDDAGTKFKMEVLGRVASVIEELPVPAALATPRKGRPKKPATPQSAVKSCKDNVDILNIQISTLKELASEKQSEIKRLVNSIVDKDRVIRNIEAKNTVLKAKLLQNQKALVEEQNQLKEAKSSGVYQRNLRLSKQLKRKEMKQNIHVHSSENAKIVQMGNQIRGLQTLVSNYKLTNRTYSEKIGQLQSEIKGLKSELVNFEAELLHFQNDDSFQTREGVGNKFTDNVEMCAMELAGECEVSSKNVKKVMKCVSKWLHGKDITSENLPCASTVVNYVDRAHILAKYQVAEEATASERWDDHTDGTTRDNKQIIGQQITLDSGKTMSVGYTPVATEDSATLLDNVIAMIDELSDVYSDCDNIEKDTVFRTLLTKMFAVMSDRCSVNKAYNNLLSAYKKDYFGTEVDTHFLFCNAHFLLGLSTVIEAKLKDIETELSTELGHALGRDAFPKFQRFKNASGSGTCRFVRTACDVLGPRGDEKNGCRMKWLSFLEENLQKKSKVTSFRMNRFNNFFHGAATLVHHSADMSDFFSNFFDSLNMKLESVLHDCESSQLLALARALGILYYKVSGPFWLMLQGDVEYVDQYLYIQQMLEKFKQWETDSTSLMARDENGIFEEFSPPKDEVYESLFSEMFASTTALTKASLEKLMKPIIEVTERQLVDFLPGGRYSTAPTEELRSSMRHCKLTNLVSEYEFGDLDFGMFKRRNASLFYHSSIQMLKRNQTISGWLSGKSWSDQQHLLKFARSKAAGMRKKYMALEKDVKVKTLAKLNEARLKRQEKQALKIASQEKITSSVLNHGGPCSNEADVARVLAGGKTKTQKMGILKNEIRYMTKVLGKKDDRLVMGKKSLDGLQADFISYLASRDSVAIADGHSSSSGGNGTGPTTGALVGTSQSETRKRKHGEISGSDSESEVVYSSDEFSAPSSDDSGEEETEWDFHYKFTCQGVPVAVAYDEGYFIGEVLKVETEELATIQFMKAGYGNTFKWPTVADVDEHVESKFVFHANFSIVVKGRCSLVPDLGFLEKQYNVYKRLFME